MTARCSITGCDRPMTVKSRGWCHLHNQRWRKYGDAEVTDEGRFWWHVDAEGPCWEWQGTKFQRGYGDFDHKQAHRWAWENLVGPIADGLTLDHLCRNTGCVNPDHLEPVTSTVNTLRGYSLPALNARKTHCIHGHPLSGANLAIGPGRRGLRRICRTCKRLGLRRRAARSAQPKSQFRCKAEVNEPHAGSPLTIGAFAVRVGLAKSTLAGYILRGEPKSSPVPEPCGGAPSWNWWCERHVDAWSAERERSRVARRACKDSTSIEAKARAKAAECDAAGIPATFGQPRLAAAARKAGIAGVGTSVWCQVVKLRKAAA